MVELVANVDTRMVQVTTKCSQQGETMAKAFVAAKVKDALA
jgi:hypothetical protein